MRALRRRVRRWVPYLLTVLTVALSVAGLVARPPALSSEKTADFVIVAGAAGLRWDDLDPQRTPTLWQEATKGSIGWLSVKSAHRATCPADGWLTLGAGNYAVWDTGEVSGDCAQAAPTIEDPDGIGANLPQLSEIARLNSEQQAYGAVPGAMAESVRCTVAVGSGAAIAAARPYGRVDKYEPTLPADPSQLFASCALSLVDLGTVTGAGRQRQAQVARADALLARVLAARPESSLMVVAGVADTDTTSRLHVAMIEGPGWEGGWLTSAGTGRDGYVQLVDLAPTILTAIGRPLPVDRFSGRTVTTVDGRPASPADSVTGDHDANVRAGAQLGIAGKFFIGLAFAQLALFLLIVPLMVRARRHAGPTGPASPPRLLLRVVEVLLIAAGLTMPAALLADAIPWWRAERPGIAFVLLTLALTAMGTLLVRLAPRFPRRLWPLGAVAVAALTIIAFDLLTGAQLQLNGIAGYSAIEGSRYTGIGSMGLGVFVAGSMLTAGVIAQRLPRSWRPLIFVLLGGLTVTMVGSAYLGADPIGAIAITAGVCAAAAISTGGWLTLPRFAWAALAGLGVTAGFAILDARRPELERGTVGRFLSALGDGSAGPSLQRAASASAQALDSPLTVIALIGALMLAFSQFSAWGGLNRVFGLYPALRGALAGTTVAALAAGLMQGTAFAVAGAASAMVVPLLVLTTMRVLDHAADRTRPDGQTDGPGGPGLLLRPAAPADGAHVVPEKAVVLNKAGAAPQKGQSDKGGAEDATVS